MPNRIILHIDFNSYFASVEAQANPFLRGTAFAVGGKAPTLRRHTAQDASPRISIHSLTHRRSVVTTASKEAKRLGVKTAMSTQEARRIIPGLPILPGDPRKYADITHRFLQILRTHCDAVEQFSTDEAFADITTAAGDFMGAVLVAQIIRDELRQKIGPFCTASIGVASNKLVAKLASESVKPNGITVVLPRDAEAFVCAQPLSDICGIGPRIQKRLEALGIISTKALNQTPLSTLTTAFGPHTGYFLFTISHGKGDDHVCADDEAAKSIGHSYTFPKNLFTKDEIHIHLLALADMVAARMRKASVFGKTVSAYARYADGGGVGVTVQSSTAVNDGITLCEVVFQKLSLQIHRDRGVRLLGISASNLIANTTSSLFLKDHKWERATRALDVIEAKYGRSTWRRASTLGATFAERVSGWHYDAPYTPIP